MRELKYRVYIPEFSKLVYFDLNNFDHSDRYLQDPEHPVQQYTGLNDSKGKEIYEGDILENHYDVGNNIIGQVLYESDHGGYIFQWKRKGRGQDYKNLNCDVAFESVIVGNIFEHSELLK